MTADDYAKRRVKRMFWTTGKGTCDWCDKERRSLARKPDTESEEGYQVCYPCVVRVFRKEWRQARES